MRSLKGVDDNVELSFGQSELEVPKTGALSLLPRLQILGEVLLAKASQSPKVLSRNRAAPREASASSISIPIIVAPTQAGTITNDVRVMATLQPDLDLTNNKATQSITVVEP